MFNTQTNIHNPSLVTSLNVKWKWKGCWQWYVLSISCEPPGYDLAPAENSCADTQTAVCETGEYALHVWWACVAYCRYRSKIKIKKKKKKVFKSGTQRLPTSAARTYSMPARGNKARFAEALVWAESVQAVSILAWAGASSWLRTLIDIWKKWRQESINKELEKER